MMPVIEVRTSPGNGQPVESRRAELDLEALAEAAFGLRINMDASSDVHTNSSGLNCSRLGRWKFFGGGKGVRRCAGESEREGVESSGEDFRPRAGWSSQ